MAEKRLIQRLLLFTFLALFISACNGFAPEGGTFVWIDVPVDGLTVLMGEAVNIEGHAANPEGITQVEIWVDGDLILTLDALPSEGNLNRFSTSWLPPGEGEYTIQAVALAGDGTASQPDSARVIVVGEDVEEPVVEFPDLDTTPTPTIFDETGPVVEFWADTTDITAGNCFTLFWHVENVASVIFGGVERDLDGSYKDCICETLTYPLTVNYLDGTQEKFRITINVTGSCEPSKPEPEVDTKKPPAPTQTGPANGSTLGSCQSYVTLFWTGVTDKSGIAGYEVQAQRHSGDSNWKTAAGSPWTGLGNTNVTISIECGWYYRWRVRAIDGAGNVGPWSSWWTFTDPLI